MRNLLVLALIAAGAAWTADRPDLSGTWQLDPVHDSKVKSKILSIQQTGDGVQITESTTASGGKEKKVDLACTVDGQQCKVKDGGNAQVSFWYSGPALVMMEMRHGTDVVIKTQWQPAEDGKTLNVQVTHISPPGQNESYTYKKQSGA